MAKSGTKLTVAVLVLLVVGIVGALIVEASRNPSFRAEEYDSLEACLAAIPAEWESGSVERTGAETACRHIHAPGAAAP